MIVSEKRRKNTHSRSGEEGVSRPRCPFSPPGSTEAAAMRLEAIDRKDTYRFCLDFMRAISAVFCLCLTSAGCPPTTLSSRGGLWRQGVLQICTVVCTLRPGGVSSSAQPQPGKEILLSERGKGREGIDIFFFLFFFVCYFELVQGFHRCIKICTVLFTFSRFGYRN